MFLGEYVSRVVKDKQNRWTVPAEFRREVGREVFITKGADYLCIYPKKEWKKLIERWEKLPLKGFEYRRFWRAICSQLREIKIDSQGRCFIPQSLKEYAGLQKEVVFVGCDKHIEIWDKEKWYKVK